MRRTAITLIGALVALSGCTAAGARPVVAPAHKTATVLFSDSFSGSKLDTTKWSNGWFGDGVHPTNPVNGSDQSCYDPAQVNVGGGQLTITATKRSCLGYAWASGLINTNGHFAFTTGTFKAKVCLPGAGPITDWPAIWTDGQHWPNDGEIDLLEGLGGNGEAHIHDSNGQHGPWGHLGAGCHKLKLVRTASTAKFYYDGVLQGTGSTSSFAGAPEYLILELAVSNSISPPIVAAQLHVNYVQVTSP